MKKLALILILLIFTYASSKIKVTCDRNGESIYLDGKYKSDCDKEETVVIFVNSGKHIVIVKKKKDKETYFFKKIFNIGDKVEKFIKSKTIMQYPISLYTYVNISMKGVNDIGEVFIDGKKIAFCKRKLNEFGCDINKTIKLAGKHIIRFKLISTDESDPRLLGIEKHFYSSSFSIKVNNKKLYWDYIYRVGDNSTGIKYDQTLICYFDNFKSKCKINTLSKNLIAYYKFEGNAKDNTGNGYDGIEYGNIKYVKGIEGKAVEFNGKDSLINIGENHPLRDIGKRDFTITFWEKSKVNENVDNTQSQPFVIKRLESPCDMLDIGVNANYGKYYGKVKIGLSDYRNECWTGEYKYDTLGGGNVNDNRWHFIVVIRKRDILKLFIDGHLINKEYVGDIIIKNGELHLGFQSDYYPNAYRGLLDNLRIYNRALNEKEVESLFKLKK